MSIYSARRALLAAALVALAAAPSAAGAAPKLRLGYYDCTTYNASSGLLYLNSVQLQAGGRYRHGFGRNGRRLSDASAGTYKVARGGRVTFRRGAMARTFAIVQPADRDQPDPYLDLYARGADASERSSVQCYFLRRP